MLKERIGQKAGLTEFIPFALIFRQPNGLGKIQRMTGLLQGLLRIITGAGLDGL